MTQTQYQLARHLGIVGQILNGWTFTSRGYKIDNDSNIKNNNDNSTTTNNKPTGTGNEKKRQERNSRGLFKNTDKRSSTEDMVSGTPISVGLPEIDLTARSQRTLKRTRSKSTADGAGGSSERGWMHWS